MCSSVAAEELDAGELSQVPWLPSCSTSPGIWSTAPPLMKSGLLPVLERRPSSSESKLAKCNPLRTFRRASIRGSITGFVFSTKAQRSYSTLTTRLSDSHRPVARSRRHRFRSKSKDALPGALDPATPLPGTWVSAFEVANGNVYVARRIATRTQQRAAELAWEQENPLVDRDSFAAEIAPKLVELSARAIARATGLSVSYCAAIKRGERVPHPRWWDALEEVTRLAG